MPENEQKLSFLEWLGREFGIQRNPEQRIEDPLQPIDSVFHQVWINYRQRLVFSKGQVAATLQNFARKANAGIISEHVVPRLEKMVAHEARYFDGLPFHYGDMETVSYYERRLKNRGTATYLYHSLIEAMQRPESITYLLQVLDSSRVVKDDQPFDTHEEFDHHEEGREEILYSGSTNPPRRYYDENTATEVGRYYVQPGDVYKVRSSYGARRPFAEMAKRRLQELECQVTDPTRSEEIAQAIAKFDQAKQSDLTIETFKRREVIKWQEIK